ncbi:hypothetical protein ABZW03_06535 [Kitasatospora sp. NPDC004799]|uniref:hypothetical protein n=1 Tax=Kitasatospora sp. NPDC004799 TaxID=3154460 RepID=UPI0033A3851A
MVETTSGQHESAVDQYVLEHSEPYFFSRYGRVEFIVFEQHLASLAWLHRKVGEAVDQETTALSTLRKSGEHRVPGWEAESDMVLDDSLSVLDTDTRQIGAGIIIVSAAAALEALMNEILCDPADRRVRKAGLARKAEVLAERWQGEGDLADFAEHISWLKVRRNAFAHRLIADDEDSKQCSWIFDDDMAEEALERLGLVAETLEEIWEQRLRPQGSDATHDDAVRQAPVS